MNLRNAVMLILGIPYLNGTMVAVLLNAILPGEDPDDFDQVEDEKKDVVPHVDMK